MQVFNRRVIKQKRNRIAKYSERCSSLIVDIYNLMCERLSNKSGLTLNLGSHSGQILKVLSDSEQVIHSDVSEEMVNNFNGCRVVLDEELIPFKNDSFDLVVSALTLHRVNDLPGALVQINDILRPKGVFIGNLFGPKTLQELKRSIVYAGVATPMIYPFVDVRDAGNLMQRAGFGMVVVDSEDFVIWYKSVDDLYQDLRLLGETNALLNMSKNITTRAVLTEIKEQYTTRYSDSNHLIPATFEIVTMTGVQRSD